MRADSIVFAVAGVLFGVIVGWVLGSQQARSTVPVAAPVAQAQAAAGQGAPAGSQAVPLDQDRVRALTSVAEQYPQAISWYEQAVAINPQDPNLSTDLGVAYYYTNQSDKAIQQFEHSLSLDAKHAKTLLNMGIVRAFGKQDLDGARQAWEQVVAISPNTPEGQAAKKGLEGLQSAHPPGATGGK